METTNKLVLLGQFGVGKTSLVKRYLEDLFKTDYIPTLGVQIKKKVLSLPEGRKVAMIIWDLEGFTSVEKIRSSYLLGSTGFLYVFDLSRPFTYENIYEDIRFLRQKYPAVSIEILGNKMDLQDPQPVLEYLAKKPLTVLGTVSAKTGEGVQEAFCEMAKIMNS